MKKYSSLLLLLFLSIASSNLYAQHFDSLLNELDTKYPQEKVYLQFDRSYYNPGETVWFKAYLTSDNLPSAISKTLYAELLDAKGTVLQRKTMPVVQASGASSFDLPDTIHSSTLYVRAYTSWMLNFDSSSLYLKPIGIITPFATAKKAIQASCSLHFFPEGGDLITGLNSRIAFKATNQYGIPVDVSGAVLDEKDNKITSFSSVHDGMGYFLITPLAGKMYKAVWKDRKGASHQTELPTAKMQGVVLSINNSNNQVSYTISRSDSVDNSFTFFYVVAQIQQQLVYSAQVNLSRKTVAIATIPADSFPDGIMQVTVFNAAQLPVAERIVFINHGNYYFNTDLHAADKNLDKRGHNALQIDVGGSLTSNLSVSVTDADLNTTTGNEQNIFSTLLLSSDLKGYIYNPAYYFSSDEDSVKQNLDLVMMTNGWRRFKWENLLTGQWPVIKYQPENYLSINGKVFGLSQSLLTNKEVTCIIKTKNANPQILTIPVSKEGEFKQSNIYFFDTAKVYYQFNNDKDKSLTSTASFSFYSSFVNIPARPGSLLNSLAPTTPDSITMQKNLAAMKLLHEAFLNGNKIKVLDVVTVVARQKTEEEKMDEEYTSGFFSNGDAHVFILDNDPSSQGALNLVNYLQGKVAGLQISMDGSGNASATWRGGSPAFFLDEMNLDIQTAQTIPMSNIAMIKVFPPPFMGGPGGSSGGAIAVYTKKGSDKNSLVKGLDFSTIIGYSSVKEFYSPDYAIKNDLTVGDYRNTLYWNPFVLMDKKTRRITVPFYNNDKCKKIKVIIEGINELGQLTREEKFFE
jgi:hypothetical protein